MCEGRKTEVCVKSDVVEKDEKGKEEVGVVEEKEFGGSVGAVLIMLTSHLIPYYLWLSVRFHDGRVFAPSWGDLELLKSFAGVSRWGFGLYLGFFAHQLALAVLVPGFKAEGLPVPSEGGRRLVYNCNGVAVWYLTLITLAGLQISGWFSLGIVIDHFGEVLTAAIVTADIMAVLAFISAKALGREHRMSGDLIYDFFMGAWLNPRIGTFDFKMWGETRMAWSTLFILTVSAAAKHYHDYGYLTPSLYFMVLAHWLYSNAVMKGEECIVTTWDIFYEKWGWMLIYWNFAGVPFVYCIQGLYLYYEGPIDLPRPFMFALFALLLVTYYIWDTSNSQRARFRMQVDGTYKPRWTFPQLPWGTLKNPKYLSTKAGSKLLINGWWKYARKIPYTCDVVFGITWGLCCGFQSAIPYFYVAFFTVMIIHRYHRDLNRCRNKYGDDWIKYEKLVPYVFIPGVY